VFVPGKYLKPPCISFAAMVALRTNKMFSSTSTLAYL
jgi:hypothetical protein